ncbi:hypothetical protein CEXT_658721 [Caerostris extrusa]|uniref:Uncharacterized protein n=1 Tax=Caerostris extrusa TaxID=172846 RepID=A0AAV4P2W9_CAEEX|nr:hypothetical protein CEXT_658721 [Caerostris extrusa]
MFQVARCKEDNKQMKYPTENNAFAASDNPEISPDTTGIRSIHLLFLTAHSNEPSHTASGRLLQMSVRFYETLSGIKCMAARQLYSTAACRPIPHPCIRPSYILSDRILNAGFLSKHERFSSHTKPSTKRNRRHRLTL